MPRNWYQIKLSRILWATFWMGVCFGAFALDYKPADQNPPLLFLILSVAVLSPFLAVGALFGSPWTGLLIGIVLVGAYVAVVSLAINFRLVSFP